MIGCLPWRLCAERAGCWRTSRTATGTRCRATLRTSSLVPRHTTCGTSGPPIVSRSTAISSEAMRWSSMPTSANPWSNATLVLAALRAQRLATELAERLPLAALRRRRGRVVPAVEVGLLASELEVALVARRVERPVLERGADRAAGLRLVGAV